MKDVLLVGYGNMGSKHAKVIEADPSCRVRAVIDPDVTVTRGLDVATFSCLDDALLSQVPLDAAVIASPTKTHLDYARRLIEAGIAVLVEKPVCTDVKALRRLAAFADGRGVAAMAGFVERFNPALFPVLLCQDPKEDGRPGERIRHIMSLRHSPKGNGDGDPIKWDLAIHDVDWIITALLPKDFEIRGAAWIEEDLSNVAIVLEEGGVYYGSASRRAHTKVRTWMVSTDQADYHVDLVAQSCYRFSNDRHEIVDVTQQEPLALQWDFFTKLLDGKRRIPTVELLGVATHQFIAQTRP